MLGAKRPWWTLATVGCIVIGLTLWWITYGHARIGGESKGPVSGERASKAPADERHRVTTVKPEKGGIQRLSVQPATIEAFYYADLYAKVSGYLKNQNVDIGDLVKEGQVLAEIDAPEYQQQLINARAELKRAKTEVTLAEARVHTAESQYRAAAAAVEEARADLKKADANLTFREIQYHRIKDLFEKKAIDERLVDEKDEERHAAAATQISARAAIITARAQEDAAQARVEQAKAELEDAHARVEVAAAQVGNAQVFVGYTRIVSPYHGVITRRTFHNGDFIRAAEKEQTPPTLTVAETDKMRTVVLVPERDAAYTRPGDKAVVRLDAIPDRVLTAKVSRISESEFRTTRAMRVEVDLQNENNELRDGMFGHVTIYLGKLLAAVNVPASCLMANDEGTGTWVYVVKDGKARRKMVKAGRNDGVRVEITAGVSLDDEVIEKPTANLSDGAPVEIVKLPGAPDHGRRPVQDARSEDKRADDASDGGENARKPAS